MFQSPIDRLSSCFRVYRRPSFRLPLRLSPTLFLSRPFCAGVDSCSPFVGALSPRATDYPSSIKRTGSPTSGEGRKSQNENSILFNFTLPSPSVFPLLLCSYSRHQLKQEQNTLSKQIENANHDLYSWRRTEDMHKFDQAPLLCFNQRREKKNCCHDIIDP